MSVAIPIFHSHYTYQLAAILEICKLESQNEVKSDCPISEIEKGISEVIWAKFHDFFTKCTRGSICKTYSIDYYCIDVFREVS